MVQDLGPFFPHGELLGADYSKNDHGHSSTPKFELEPNEYYKLCELAREKGELAVQASVVLIAAVTTVGATHLERSTLTTAMGR